MTGKEFLNQAFYIDQRIVSKLEQIRCLRETAEKVTTTYTDVPGSGSHNNHKMEDTILKIVAMEDELNDEVSKLMDVKVAIMKAIRLVDNDEYRTVLELRYICLKSWEDIADDMRCGTRNIFKLHGFAMKNFYKIYEKFSKVQ